VATVEPKQKPKANGEKAARDGAAQVAMQAVVAVGARAAERGWTPATAGNFSVRVDDKRVAITRSGADKGAMTHADVIVLSLDNPKVPGISAEAPLHVALYQDAPAVRAVWHVHSPAAVLASRLRARDGVIVLENWELLKVLSGISTHEARVVLPVLANDQDTDRLAAAASRWFETPPRVGIPAPGYLIDGHGLYAWGGSPQEAWRHLEALETLLGYELELERRRS
jgi:methylthioribulose-1-phosphate dehydratase